MHNTKYNQMQVVKYLIWTFLPAYIIQIGAAYVYNHMSRLIGQLAVAGMMFIPTFGVLLSGNKLKGMGWKPQIRKNRNTILIAWFAPVVLTVIGAGLYFLIFPGHFDLTGEYIAASGGAEALSQMQAQGISYSLFALIGVICSMTYAPLINMFLALGEEIGWRGYLYPQLKAGFGRNKGWILGGIIWGAWHWPLIWLIGYEYGTATGNPAGYFGFPFVGMLIFCIITAGWGILHDWLYERSGSIWIPSLFHGAINAAATLPFTVCMANTGSARLLGPSPNGIIAGLPFLAVALVLLLRREEERCIEKKSD